MPLTTPVKHCGRFDSSIELIVVNRLYPGDYLGEASLLTGVARDAAVEAVTAATVYEIDKANFEPFLIARPEMVEMLAHTLARRNSHRDSNAIAVPAATALTAIANQIRTFFRNDRGPRSQKRAGVLPAFVVAAARLFLEAGEPDVRSCAGCGEAVGAGQIPSP